MSRRRYSPASPPVALTIAGSDSGGGAGIQADLKTMEAHGVFGTSVIAATTAQNTTGVRDVHVLPADHVESQYRAVIEDFDVRAIKTGMLATAEIVETVTDCLSAYGGELVVDPVMVATSGDRLLSEEAEEAYEALVAESTLVTPNADEATVLTGIEVVDGESARRAGETLVEMGADAALVKGGHLAADSVVDTLVVPSDDGYRARRFEHGRVDAAATHGSGCTLSSSIAARLARGESFAESVAGGVAFMERAVRYGIDVGEGPGSVQHLVELRERADRETTAERVERIVNRLVERDVAALVPEVGMNVVGATRFAEAPEEVVGVDGRITRTRSGIRPNRGVRSGASTHLARRLLDAREAWPELRYAVNCRFDDDVDAALSALDGAIVEGEPFDRGGGDRPPVAAIDRGGGGREPTVALLARDPEALVDRTLTLFEALEPGPTRR